MGSRTVLSAAQPWVTMAGGLYGVPQSMLLGEVRMKWTGPVDLARIDGAIAAAAPDLIYDPGALTGPAGIGDRIARLAVALQAYFGQPVSERHFASCSQIADDVHSFGVALPYYYMTAGRAVIDWTIAAFDHLLRSESPAEMTAWLKDGLLALSPEVVKFNPHANLFHFISAAYRLDIPVSRLAGNVFRFGTGRYSCLVDSSFTGRTSAIGCNIARSKYMTAMILRGDGLPAPEQAAVNTPEQAIAAAGKLGYPVAVKPDNQDGGRGVFAGLTNEASVRAAAIEVKSLSELILVEKHFVGLDFRLTIYDGEVVKVEQRVAGSVIGDGRLTVAELVAAKQLTPHFEKFLRTTGRTVLSLDTEALDLVREQGLTPDAVPEDGRRVWLRRKNNISTGGEQVGIPIAAVHPDNIALATRAAKLLQLDLAGIDLLIPDIGESWAVSGALICEVNARPEIDVHTSPDVYADILRRIVGPSSRVPAHLLIVDDDTDIAEVELPGLMAKFGCESIATAKGVWVNGRRLITRPPNSFASAQTLLAEPEVESAVCVMPIGDVIGRGLPLDRFSSIVLNTRQANLDQLRSVLQPHADRLGMAAAHA